MHYSIEVAFTSQQVQDMGTGGYKLCFASGVGSHTFNVIAWTSEIAPHLTISWDTLYKIAGSSNQFQNGVQITANTNLTDITFQHDYTLPADWSDGKTTPNTNLHPTSFRFINNTSNPASAIVYMNIEGQPRPIYVSKAPIFSKGNETIDPSSLVALWLQTDVETGMANPGVDSEESAVTYFESVPTLNVTWNGSGFVEAS